MRVPENQTIIYMYVLIFANFYSKTSEASTINYNRHNRDKNTMQNF